MSEEYTDIQELYAGRYKRIKCQECSKPLWALSTFRRDKWWCKGCMPRKLRENTEKFVEPHVTVNIGPTESEAL